MGSLLQVCLAAQGGASSTPRGTAHMKKTLLAFLIVGLLVSTGYARGGHGGRRHAEGMVSVRGSSTKGEVNPSPGKPGTKVPYGSMGGYSGGYGTRHNGHVDVNPSAMSSEMDAPQAGAALQESQDHSVSPSAYWSFNNDNGEISDNIWELSVCMTHGTQRGEGDDTNHRRIFTWRAWTTFVRESKPWNSR